MRPCPTDTSFAGEKPEIPVLDAEDPVKRTFDAFFSSSPPSGRGEGKAGQSGRASPGPVRAGMRAASKGAASLRRSTKRSKELRHPTGKGAGTSAPSGKNGTGIDRARITIRNRMKHNR